MQVALTGVDMAMWIGYAVVVLISIYIAWTRSGLKYKTLLEVEEEKAKKK
jgi:hypothetical protein